MATLFLEMGAVAVAPWKLAGLVLKGPLTLILEQLQAVAEDGRKFSKDISRWRLWRLNAFVTHFRLTLSCWMLRRLCEIQCLCSSRRYVHFNLWWWPCGSWGGDLPWQLTFTSGKGVLPWFWEACDDGNYRGDDGCTGDCRAELLTSLFVFQTQSCILIGTIIYQYIIRYFSIIFRFSFPLKALDVEVEPLYGCFLPAAAELLQAFLWMRQKDLREKDCENCRCPTLSGQAMVPKHPFVSGLSEIHG